MPAPQPQTSLGLSITNPLVLYRALISTKRIRPDPAQHRLALQLQQLYFRLKDYDPDVEFRYRLDRAARLARKGDVTRPEARKAVFDEQGRGRAGRWLGGGPSDGRGLVKTIPVTESALEIDSPQGMLLYGEVGRGKSMLLDLLFDSLPTRKKRRWHFNTFMLDIFRRLELARIEKLNDDGLFGSLSHDHVVLALARETMETSPILFLDEFQLPDRVAGKLVNGFLVSFFSLGGVMVASSNRMPEELAKAQGMEFRRLAANMKGEGKLWWQLRGRSEGEKAAASDFGVFVEVLKKRCEVWEMEGQRDWRRDTESVGEVGQSATTVEDGDEAANTTSTSNEERHSVRNAAKNNLGISRAYASQTAPATSEPDSLESSSTSSDTPQHYHVSTSASLSEPLPEAYIQDLTRLNPTQQWVPTTLIVYARKLHLTQTLPDVGIALLPFSIICASNLGPADYISICSSFHTLIITSVPVLTTLQKNEARRFITLLDACYEARCKLLIEAAAPPDRLFFPETRMRRGGVGEMIDDRGDSIDSEAFSEMYQESTSPFRPNVSSYTDASASPTKSIFNPDLRTVLADEDADFGPTYGNGRGHGASQSDGVDDEMDTRRAPRGFEELERRQGPDFTQTGALTGEDERFAYKRARSRLWEMCGKRWWDQREGRDPAEWWTPVHREGRFWEKSSNLVDDEVLHEARRSVSVEGSHDGSRRRADSGVHTAAKNGDDEGIFRHGASPFRTVAEPPPKFGWQHAWGMMRWGRKAGEWGKGIEGDRMRDKEHKAGS